MIEIRPFHLKVLSSLFINVAAGFVILALTTKDPRVLTGELFFGILFIVTALKLEQILEDYYDKFR